MMGTASAKSYAKYFEKALAKALESFFVDLGQIVKK